MIYHRRDYSKYIAGTVTAGLECAPANEWIFPLLEIDSLIHTRWFSIISARKLKGLRSRCGVLSTSSVQLRQVTEWCGPREVVWRAGYPTRRFYERVFLHPDLLSRMVPESWEWIPFIGRPWYAYFSSAMK